ncbi:MAG: glycosyltransferase family 39 protein [Flavobacteriales bacterium]|nr:glycosyltransferase family 39 protein [Flavobacteriales bacterium]
MLSQYKWPLVFVVLLVGIFFFYNYDEILFKRPQSVHYWRQADCASLALNYYQGGMDFFHPQVHNLTSEDFTTGYTSTSEMPLLYYSVAILYQAFGYHEFLYRLLNVMIFFTGLFYLYKLFLGLIKHQFWAMSLPLLLFSSPVLAYYANNFLSNSAALGFVFIGWYHFLEYSRNKNSKSFKWSILFFGIAGLLKITALLSLGAIISIYLLEKIIINKKEPLFSRGLGQFVPFTLVFLIIGAWTLYASFYNSHYGTSYFSTTIFPIWEMSTAEIIAVKDNVTKIWFDQYFSEFLWGFLFLATIAIILLQKGARIMYVQLTCFMLLGAWAFMLLQYATLKDHDYYTINLFIIPVFIFITFFDLIKTHFPRVIKSKIAIMLFLVFTLFNVNYAKTELNDRYNGGWNNDGIKNDIEDVVPYLRSIGITHADTIISMPDQSHLSLYLMNQRGWTEYEERFYNRGATRSLNRDQGGMEASIVNGAKYLVINGLNELYQRPFLHKFAAHLIGQFREVLIFDLTKLGSRNFKLPKRLVKELMVCNAELLEASGDVYTGLHGNYTFGDVSTRSNEFAYSGAYSSKLTPENPYGLTLTIPKVFHGESFIVSIMRKKEAGSFDLVAATPGKPSFRLKQMETLACDNPAWEILKMEFHIPKHMDGRSLSIYCWNHGSEPAYADDLKVVRFHSYFK